MSALDEMKKGTQKMWSKWLLRKFIGPEPDLYTITAGPLTITDATIEEVITFKNTWRGSTIPYEITLQKKTPPKRG
jgi:hypothetical protein